LAENPASLQRLCAALVAGGIPLALMRIPQNDAVSAELARSCRRRGKLLIVSSPPCLQVDLGQGWDHYLASRKSEIRTGYKRRLRQLETIGPVVFDSRRPSLAEADPMLHEAFDVEADGWKGVAGSAMRHKRNVGQFVTELARRFAASGELRISFLRVNTRAVAMSIDLEFDGSLWGIKTGYRESAHRASPGMLLMREILRDACSRNLNRYEFLGCGDGSQAAWATGARRLQTLVYYPYSFRGMLAFGMDVISHMAGKSHRIRRLKADIEHRAD
jgi:CelD/BcsL family acetyltransferase involved in cellulose biosynthesis